MKVLIMGAGKSGTTAVTYGIKAKLPNHEIVFEPVSLEKIDYAQENAIVKMVKVKGWKQQETFFTRFDKKILIVRHPYDRLISYLLYIPYNGFGFSSDINASSYVDMLRKKTIEPQSVHTLDLIENLDKITNFNTLKELQKENNQVLSLYRKKDTQFHLLKYEDFIDFNVKSLENYLGITFPDRVEVDSKHKRVVRSKQYGDWKNWFTKKDVEQISKCFTNFNSEFGYEENLPPKMLPKINPESSYLYTIDLINECRKRRFLPEYEVGKIKIGEEGVWIDKAINSLKRNQFYDAEDAIHKAIEINNNFPSLHLIQGNIFAKQNKLHEAAKAISYALELNPNFENARRRLKKVLAQLKTLE